MADALLTIDRMTYGGAGFGKVSGKACFVPFTAPGDEVRVRITQEKKSFLTGELIDVLTPSSSRTTPGCFFFGQCGGCSWQHLDYLEQLRQKQAIFHEILWRMGRVSDHLILPIIGSESVFGYRSRIQLKLRHVNGLLHAGFYKTGSHYVIDIKDNCPIACGYINAQLHRVREIVMDSSEPEKVPQVDIASGENGDVIVIIHYIGNHVSKFHSFLCDNKNRLSAWSGLFIQQGRKASLTKVFGKEKLSYNIPEDKSVGGATVLTFSKGGFSQVNRSMNAILVQTALEWAEFTGSERVLDIYCGNGNFSIPIAPYVSEIIGIEEYHGSILDAKQNCLDNNVGNASFHCCDAASGVADLLNAGERFDVILLDPPRSGAGEVVNLIPMLAPKSIIYVSCDPTTLARDLGRLKGHGFEVIKSLPVDMFPQTYHLESITLLRTTNH